MDDRPLGELIGRGRAADVYDVGGGRVLRRNRDGSPVERQALVMRHVREHGVPVPQVFDATGPDIVMRRLEGQTMLRALTTSPWRFHALADQLAELHRVLERVPIAALLAAGVGERFVRPDRPVDCVLHLDLHPDNVMLTDDGPVLFDWTNAVLGPRGADVANTWVVLATSDIDVGTPAIRVVARALRNRFVERFLDRAGRRSARRLLADVARARIEDPNVRPGEAERIRAMIADAG